MANQILLAAAVGVLPAGLWLWFWLREDRVHPEPRSVLGTVFIFGALAVIPAFFIEKALANYLAFNPYQVLSDWRQLGLAVLSWSAVEEILKFAAVYLAAFWRRVYDEPVDAMVYMITGAIGFAAVENTLFVWNALTSANPLVPGADFLLTGNFRFLGATLLHIVTSAFLGGLLGLSFYRSRWSRRTYLVWGLVGAIVLHAVFNYFIISTDPRYIFRIFGVIWLGGILIILLFERIKAIKRT